MLVPESFDGLLSLPNDDPLLVHVVPPPYKRTFDGGGNELAELSLNVDTESRSAELPLRERADGFLNDALEPPLSDKRPYSPNFLGDGISERAGDALLLLAFELNESPPSDFLRGISFSGKRLYSPIRLGRPLRCDEERGGLGKELGGKLSGQ